MNRTTLYSLILIIMACPVWSIAQSEMNTLTRAEETSGWRLLFDGKTLNGWNSIGDEDVWRVHEGTIINDKPREEGFYGQRGYLHTRERFGDFILHFEFKLAPATNSGLFFRWGNLDDPIYTGIELQLYDSYKDLGSSMEKMTSAHCGSIYEIMAPKYNVYKPAGEWNTVTLTCYDSIIRVEMNGMRTILLNLDRWTEAGKNPDGTPNKYFVAYKDMPREGYIGLQDYRGVIQVRNMKIRPF